MAITFVGGAGRQQQNSVTVTLPSGVAPGDIVMCMTSVFYTVEVSYPAGWDVFVSDTLEGFREFQAGIHVMSAGDPTSYTWSGSGYFDVILGVWRGVDTQNPFSTTDHRYGFASANPFTETIPSMAVTADDSALVVIAHPQQRRLPDAQPPLTHLFSPGGRLTSLWHQTGIGAGETGTRTLSDATSGTNNVSYLATALRPAGDSPPPPTAKPWTRAFIVE